MKAGGKRVVKKSADDNGNVEKETKKFDKTRYSVFCLTKLLISLWIWVEVKFSCFQMLVQSQHLMNMFHIKSAVLGYDGMCSGFLNPLAVTFISWLLFFFFRILVCNRALKVVHQIDACGWCISKNVSALCMKLKNHAVFSSMPLMICLDNLALILLYIVWFVLQVPADPV